MKTNWLSIAAILALAGCLFMAWHIWYSFWSLTLIGLAAAILDYLLFDDRFGLTLFKPALSTDDKNEVHP